ncbi:leucine-rich repeat domain-containing protein [Candidatus Lokiarchaeum ossiferum]|uniref:leucine-rich repeat domain-containing protein n=1 Tax=Candidatus Lokiarchaeum ossiferum TaxID=2951803 RepID=UPI00352C8F27
MKMIEKLKKAMNLEIPMVKQVLWNTYGYSCSEDKITGLGFYGQPLTEIPPDLFLFQELEVLALTNTKLPNLPQDIGYLKSLKELYLGGNLFRSIPNEVGELKKLRVLYILEDNLQQIPNSILKLSNLKELSITVPFKLDKSWNWQDLSKKGCKIYWNNKEIFQN